MKYENSLMQVRPMLLMQLMVIQNIVLHVHHHHQHRQPSQQELQGGGLVGTFTVAAGEVGVIGSCE